MNLRLPPCQGGTLTKLSYAPIYIIIVFKATTGVEPVIKVLQTSALTTWPRRHKAGNGIRTRDPQLGKLMLYQLSYSRKFIRIPGIRDVNNRQIFIGCKARPFLPDNEFLPCMQVFIKPVSPVTPATGTSNPTLYKFLND